MKKFFSILAFSALLFTSTIACDVYNAETGGLPATLAGFTKSATGKLAGSFSYRSNAFWSGGGPYTIQSAAFPVANFDWNWIGQLNYNIVIGAGAGTWTMKWQLFTSANVLIGSIKLTDLTGTGNASGTLYYPTFSPNDPVYNSINGLVYWKITLTTTNTTNNTNSRVIIDDVATCIAPILAGSSGGYYTVPSFSLAYSNVFKDLDRASNTYADVVATKAAQSIGCTPGCRAYSTYINIQKYRTPIAGGEMEWVSATEYNGFTPSTSAQSYTLSDQIIKDATYDYTYKIFYWDPQVLYNYDNYAVGADPVLPGTIGWRWAVGAPNTVLLDACDAVAVYAYAYTASNSIAVSTQAYTNALLTSTFSNPYPTKYYLAIALGRVYQLSSTGVVTSSNGCP